jgi:hypothetical protein
MLQESEINLLTIFSRLLRPSDKLEFAKDAIKKQLHEG